MERSLLKTFGFTDRRRQSLVSLLGLQVSDRQWATYLHEAAIVPNCECIVTLFFEHLQAHNEFTRYLPPGVDSVHLRETQKTYLLSLGVDFDSAPYFESRFRVGLAHARARIPLTLYEAAHAYLQLLLLQHIPREMRAAVSLTEFIIKISTLDMALATEAYHASRVDTLQQSLRALRDQTHELHRLIDTDTFTGLASHAHILDVLVHSLADADQSPVSLITVDIDRFKDINDRYGHLIGDYVIRSVARRLISVARHNDAVGRCGGDEFMVVLRRTSPAAVASFARRLCARVGGHRYEIDGIKIRVTVSVGVAAASDGEGAEALIARADGALYRAKRDGRNRVVVDVASGAESSTSTGHDDAICHRPVVGTR